MRLTMWQKEFADRVWKKLKFEHQELNGFEDLEDLYQWVSKQDCFPDGKLSRIDPDFGFSRGNLLIYDPASREDAWEPVL